MKRKIIIISLFVGLAAWQCSKYDSSRPDLKQSLTMHSENINNAVTNISATRGYQMLSVGSDLGKSQTTFNAVTAETSFRDSITLNLVKGIYDYRPDTMPRYHMYFPYRFFKKTGASQHIIVNLPERLIFHPKYMHYYVPTDSTFKNNFTIDASDYHFYYNWWNSFDYKLSAGFILDTKSIGSLDLMTGASSFIQRNYSAKFAFNDNYSVATTWETGDTTRSSFSLNQGTDTLLKESNLFIRTGDKHREKQYTLTIGNVIIKRSSAIDSIQVFLDGVLQKKAAVKVEIEDNDKSENSGTICSDRDILITFNDGTNTKLSTLIGPALTKLRPLLDSMRSMYFAKNVVDYIALSIYFNTH